MTPTRTQPAADRPTREDIETLISAAEDSYAKCRDFKRDCDKVYGAQAHLQPAVTQRKRALALARSLLATHGYEVKP